MEEVTSSENSFKKPLLPAKELSSANVKKHVDPLKNDLVKDEQESTEEKMSGTESSASNDEIQNKQVTKPRVNVPLPYQEPEWHGHPPPNYLLEIIKNGTFVSTYPLKASLTVFGRLDVCDIVFEHPSVSRYHAIIQYCKGDNTHLKGFYLYDLGSTHGTFLNKEKIKANIYYKLKVGYIVKFGGSSRLHIFQGPEEDDDESKPKEIQESKVSEDDVCDWGLGEEAEEEEDLTENPFALEATNEELYIDDPKKTLRGWFEREGYELEYSVEEKGYRTFSCTVRLPVDNPTGEYLPIETSVSGKKKEAVIACALEACRTLDRLGLLRQSHQESRQRKRKKWEENDYYDSDEDTFYDRTGEIEKRREMRKRLSKKVEVDNFATISVKLENLNTEIAEIKKKISINESKSDGNSVSGENDPLDMYMSKLSESNSTISDKFERRKLKLRLMELEKEKLHFEKLSDIAKPASLPPLAKRHGLIGKKLKSKLKLPSSVTTETVKTTENEMEVEEEDSEKEEESAEIKKVDVNEDKAMDSSIEKRDTTKNHNIDTNENEEISKTKKYGLMLNASLETKSFEPKTVSDEAMSENVIESKMLTNEKTESSNLSASSDCFVEKTEQSLDTIPTQESEKKNSVKKSKKKSSKQSIDVYKTDSNEYCTWMPPSNQSGDGMTHLNEKYGY